MRAAVFRGPSSPVAVEEVQLAAPGPGEIRVRIAAAGVCHSDLHVRQGDWQLPSPLILGHEGSGVILETGASVDDLAVGDHVVLLWVAPCGTCRPCTLGQPVRCLTAATIVAPGGVLNDGTSRLTIDGQRARCGTRPPSHPERTSWSSVVAESDCRSCRAPASRVQSASSPSICDAKRPLWQVTLGATNEIDGSAVDVVQSLKALLPDGADFAFDAIGGAATTRQCIDMIGVGGTVVVVGIPRAGTTVTFEPQTLVDFDQRIIGSNYGGIDPLRDIPQLVDLYMSGDLFLDELISARRPLGDAGRSLDDLAAGATLRQLLIP